MSDQRDVQPQSPPAASSAATTAAAPTSKLSELGAAVLTVLFSLLLIDAAVETFLSGAPVRWWAVGVVAGYVALRVLHVRGGDGGRRLLAWSGRPTAAVFVLLGLIAATAWMPEGLTRGLMMLRLSTSVVVSSVSAVAVAFAGLMLIRMRTVPLWGRFAVGLLAAYGVAAFIAAAIQAAPYASLFDGSSLWRRLPVWLQGSFAGVAVVFAATIATAGRLVDRVVLPANRASLARQFVALTLCLVLTWSGIASTGALGIPRGARETPTATAELAERFFSVGKAPLRVAPSDLPAVLGRLQALAQQLDRREFDVDALADSLPTSVDQVFGFVRDFISYEAYDGVLRGAEGTLLSRAGNSYDKSLLLAALLRRKGFRVRFTSGHISDERVGVLVGQMFEGSRPFGAAPSEEAMAAAAGLSANDAQRAVRSLGNDKWGEQFRDLVKESLTATRRLMAPYIAADAQFDIRSTMKDHAWLQLERHGAWIDLDSSFRASQVGERHADGAVVGDALPAPKSWRFRLEVRAIQRQGADRRHKTLAQWSWPISDVLTSKLQLLLVPAANTEGRLFTSEDLDGSERFVPIIRVNEEIQVGQLFDLSGDVGAEVTNPAQRLGSRIGGILAGRGIGDERVAPDPKVLESIIAQYILVSPTGAEKLEDRSLYQRAFEGRSATEASNEKIRLLGSYNIQVSAGLTPASYVFERLSRNMAVNQPLLEIAAGLRPAPPPEKLVAALEEFREDPLHLLLLAHLSAFSHLDSLDQSRQYRFYIARPNVATYKRRALERRGRSYILEEGFDVIHDGIEVIPRSGRSDAWCFEMRLRRGIFVSALELGLHPDATSAFGALNVIHEARRTDITLQVLGPKDAGKLSLLRLAEQDRDRIDTVLRAGGHVILPEQPVVVQQRPRTAWIRIDRAGNSLGISEGGGGQASVEKGALIAAGVGGILGALGGFWGCASRNLSTSQCVTNVLCNIFFGALFGVLVFLASGGISYALNALLMDAAYVAVFDWALLKWAIFAAIFAVIKAAICGGVGRTAEPSRGAAGDSDGRTKRPRRLHPRCSIAAWPGRRRVIRLHERQHPPGHSLAEGW